MRLPIRASFAALCALSSTVRAQAPALPAAARAPATASVSSASSTASPTLPPGRLDSALVDRLTVEADQVTRFDVARAHRIHLALAERRADLPGRWPEWIEIAVATTSGSGARQLAARRAIFEREPTLTNRVGYWRVLLNQGYFDEALAVARAWTPAPGTPPRALVEETEAHAAHHRGDAVRALAAARAMRAVPGADRNPQAWTHQIAALAMLGRTRELAAAVDSALGIEVRGYRVDPTTFWSTVGAELMRHGQPVQARRAFARTLARLDSSIAADPELTRDPVLADSLRVRRAQALAGLGRWAEVRALTTAGPVALAELERRRLGLLGIALARTGDAAGARAVERRLAAPDTLMTNAATRAAQATVLAALGEPRRAADVLLADEDRLDFRLVHATWALGAALDDPRVRRLQRGRVR